MKFLSTTPLLAVLFVAGKASAGDCPPGSNLLWLDVHVDLDLHAQKDTDETSWTLTNLCTGTVLIDKEADDYEHMEQTHEGWCLNPYNKYKFTIRDGWGDGLGSGEYRLVWDGEMIADGQRAWRSEDNAEFGDDVCFGTSLLVPLPAGGGGDPHFKTFTGNYFDFHGACDLVLIDVPSYNNGQGMELHVRTKGRFDYSFIESAALRIGDDILEVSSWGEVLVNGIAGFEAFPLTLGGLATATYAHRDQKKHVYEIELDEESKIIISTFKDWVSVSIDFKTFDNFQDAKGLVGSTSGKMLARDGKTNLGKDPIAFGKEWQVQENESKLFQRVNNFPQYPEQCVMPDPNATPTQEGRRRLGEKNDISNEDAKAACAKWGRTDMKACIFDVIASGDLDMAEAGGF